MNLVVSFGFSLLRTFKERAKKNHFVGYGTLVLFRLKLLIFLFKPLKIKFADLNLDTDHKTLSC